MHDDRISPLIPSTHHTSGTAPSTARRRPSRSCVLPAERSGLPRSRGRCARWRPSSEVTAGRFRFVGRRVYTALMLATALEAIAPHRLAAELGRSATCAE